MTYENLKEFLEKELEELKELLNSNYTWVIPSRQIARARFESFGVVEFFIKYSDIGFKEIEALWDEYLNIYNKMESEVRENAKNWKRGRKTEWKRKQ